MTRTERLGRGAWPLAAPAVALLVLAFYLPVMRLLWTADFRSYQRLWADPLYVAVLLRTVRVALQVSLGALMLGYPVAWLLSRLRGWQALLVTGLVLLPLWTSILVRTYAWTVLLQRNGLLNDVLRSLGLIDRPIPMLYTEGAVVAATIHVLLPFLILPVWSALGQIPDDYVRAARVMGASGGRIFRRITVPLSLPGVWSGCLFVFLLSLGFFVTPALIGGPRQTMIGTLIQQQAMEALDWPFTAAIGVMVTALVVVLLPLFQRVFDLGEAKAR